MHGSQGLRETAINRPGCVYHTSIIHVDYVDYVRVYVPNWTLWAAGSMPHLRPRGDGAIPYTHFLECSMAVVTIDSTPSRVILLPDLRVAVLALP